MKDNFPSSNFKSPELDKELQDSALRNRGGDNWGNEFFIPANQLGSLVKKINPDAYMNDLAQYWALHEKKLWTVLAICLLFLTMKLLGS